MSRAHEILQQLPTLSEHALPDRLQLNRWVRALGIAKILFEEQGYHTEYLEQIERYLKGMRG